MREALNNRPSMTIEKIIALSLMLMTTLYGGTLTVFTLRYMWFSVQTIPADRMGLAILGVTIWGGITAMYLAVVEPFKRYN